VAAKPGARRAADSVLAAGYAIHLGPLVPLRQVKRAQPCTVAGRTVGSAARAVPGRVRLTNRGASPAAVGLRRFGPSGATVALGTLPPGSATILGLPGDDVPVAWHLEFGAPVVVEQCA
jgi:hypothetical protein